MKIAEIDNIVCVDINNLAKFNLIKDKLENPITECIVATPYFNKTVEEYIEVLRYNIENINNRFKLVVALDMDSKELVFFSTFFIIQDDSGPSCLLYALWSKPRLVVPIADVVLPYIDKFAIMFRCNKMTFYTDATRTAFERLGKKYGWKPKRLVFERSLEP